MFRFFSTLSLVGLILVSAVFSEPSLPPDKGWVDPPLIAEAFHTHVRTDYVERYYCLDSANVMLLYTVGARKVGEVRWRRTAPDKKWRLIKIWISPLLDRLSEGGIVARFKRSVNKGDL